MDKYGDHFLHMYLQRHYRKTLPNLQTDGRTDSKKLCK